jgi:uncharacterized peroxidase-related enzyme
MSKARLITRDENDLSAETLAVLEAVRMNGKLSDVYLQFANSEPAIRAYRQMEQSLAAGSLSAKELECIKLFVSQRTQCDFCLSVHTMKASALGIDAEQQLNVRRGTPSGDARLDAMLAIVRAFFEKPGPINDTQLQNARDHGLTDQQLVDLTMAVSTIFFTNITNHINDTPVTLKPAPPL